MDVCDSDFYTNKLKVLHFFLFYTTLIVPIKTIPHVLNVFHLSDLCNILGGILMSLPGSTFIYLYLCLCIYDNHMVSGPMENIYTLA